MTKRIALASLFAVALAAGVTQAQAQAPSAGGGNVVGGGLGATMLGGDDNRVILYGQPGAGGGGAGWSQAGLQARFASGHGDGPQVEYVAPAPAGAGREARLVGGGADAEVVYARPR